MNHAVWYIRKRGDGGEGVGPCREERRLGSETVVELYPLLGLALAPAGMGNMLRMCLSDT